MFLDLFDWWEAFQHVRFILRYGPDIAHQLARAPSFDDVAKVALANWSTEGVLLCRRHHLFIQTLVNDGIISRELGEACTRETDFSSLQQALEIAQKAEGEGADGPTVFEFEVSFALPVLSRAQLPDRLCKKLKELERDEYAFAKSIKTALSLAQLIAHSSSTLRTKLLARIANKPPP